MLSLTEPGSLTVGISKYGRARVMKTVLDLISEFGALNDTKVRSGGSLPLKDEERWTELKAFYELLMSRVGLVETPDAPRFSASDIRDHLTGRERIRVPVESPIVFEHQSRYHTARLVNLSCGGVYLASETLVDTGSLLTLFLASISTHEEDIFETKGEVVWCTKRGMPEVDLPRGMGVRFVEFPHTAQEKLDSYVVETIAKRLSGLW